MPTIPSGSDPHQQRQIAESFGVDAERYDRARPSYPVPLIERIVTAGREVLSVGCGTGIDARQFQAAGCTVLGVEPDARMARFARDTGVEVEVATFEAWDAAGRTFDAVVAAQAWHWVDPVAGAAKAARVLRPGGRLAVFWNSFHPPVEVAEALGAAYRRVLPDAPDPTSAAGDSDPYGLMCEKAEDGMRQAGGFGQPERWRFSWEHVYTRDEWLDQVPTSGLFTRLPPEQLAEVLASVGDALDAIGGAFTMRYTTVAVTALHTP
ncbi:class I SAM-dependent methyltransferase [Nonomuraea aridisoli]|uniref:SAM-dependent methyltransferase n=1 Tax=Nonomuraea aridisoli TaxID=2070368 RepID=A0A2W2DYS8_9ACTN|nr:class I SAM-dependent methyltransferase [Nonomuraea aridisoli]PZG10235.1 SAM-dependent methyltransferase [Nonomuraea aridisoli]